MLMQKKTMTNNDLKKHTALTTDLPANELHTCEVCLKRQTPLTAQADCFIFWCEWLSAASQREGRCVVDTPPLLVLNIAGLRVLLCELSQVFYPFGKNPAFKIPQASGAQASDSCSRQVYNLLFHVKVYFLLCCFV